MSDDRPFDRPWDLAVICLRQKFSGERPILLVCHDHEGDWQFLDGTDNPRAEDAMIVGLGHRRELDPTVAELGDLPRDWIGWRAAPHRSWERATRPLDDDDA